MAIMIRKNQDIQGVQMSQGELKIVQFADDSTCLLKDATSLKPLISTLTTFIRWAGLKLNKSKSMILVPGATDHDQASLEGTPDQASFEGIPVVREMKILGIWFCQEDSIQNNMRCNFTPLLNKIRSMCESWSNRSLSLKGKVTVVNSLLIS